jgi:uncharacterized protein (TIGR03437 family)
MGVFFHSPRRKGLIPRVFLFAAAVAAGLGFGLSTGFAQESSGPVPRSLEWEQWFYGQRTYGLGYIPEEALPRAVIQRDGQRNRAQTSTGLGKLTVGSRALETDTPPAAESDTWVSLGPGGIVSTRGDAVSGRVTSLAIDPRNSSTVYVAAAGGGVWKTTNRGKRWQPLTDQLPSLASGAVAVDPFSGDVWYGTGELNFCRDCYYGAGVYRSRDGGATWERVAAETFLSSPTSVIRFDPRNPGSLLIGRSTALWKSRDYGASWRAVLRGAITDVAYNPADPSVAYAAVGNFSGSPDNGVYRSVDGGETWARVTEGLAGQESIGRIALGTSPTNPSQVYALIVRSSDFNLNGLFRSLDGGVTWSLVPSLPQHIFAEDGQGQGAFNLFVRVDPRDAGVLYVGARDLWKSTDFGNTWRNLSETVVLHEDQRDIVFDPADPQTFYLIGDSGVWRSSDGGQSFASLNSTLAVTQFQTVGLHPTNPNLAVGGTQDNGTILFRGGYAWNQSRPGDSGVALFDRVNPQTIFTVARRLSVRRSDDGGNSFRVIAEGLDPNDRVQFYPPLVADPNQPGTLYFGTQRVWRSTDGGEHWTPLSGDLTGGGSATVTALAVAPSSSLVIYAGTSDGLVQVSRDGGSTWASAGTLAGRFVTSIAVHALLAERAYATLSGFGTGHVFRTENGGGSWEDISRDLPDIPVNAVLVEPLSDRVAVGTDIGVFLLSPDGTWLPLKKGLPNAVVLGLSQNPATGLLVAATHGRGAFALLLREPALTAPRIDAMVNAAGFENGPLAPGMAVTLFGSNLAPNATAAPAGLPLPASLEGTTVTLNGAAAPVRAVAPGEVTFVVPYDVAGPLVDVVLRSRTGEAAVQTPIAAVSPGIFLAGADGSIYHGDGRRVWDFSPARSGEELVLYASGLGAVTPTVLAGLPAPSSPAARTDLAPRIRIGGQLAEVRFAGLTPNLIGIYQVNFVVPAGLAGRFPLVLESGAASSNTVLLPVVP